MRTISTWLKLLFAPILLLFISVPCSASEESSSASIGKWCREMQAKYGVVIYESFGDLPRDLIPQWESKSCNAYIKQTAKLRGGIEVDSLEKLSSSIAATAGKQLTPQQTHRHQKQLDILYSYIKEGKCRHVYLDMGTSIGIHIRKLYQPEQYPDAMILPFFDEHFGDRSLRRGVCTVGFEPNPKHNKVLDRLQVQYQKAGFPVVILTESAVSIKDGRLTLYHDKFGGLEAAASVMNWQEVREDSERETVIAVDIDSLIKKIDRRLRGKNESIGNSSKIIIKMDIEGAEFNVVPHMIGKGSLCMVDYMLLEWHFRYINAPRANSILKSQEKVESVMDWVTANTLGCRFHLVELDDESYSNGERDVPYPSPTL